MDEVSAVPGSSVSLDVTGTAGESLAAGDAVYMSTGAGGLNATQWYRTDSDAILTSVGAFQVGMAPAAIAAGASGTIRLSGSVTVTGPLSAGAPYYAGATPGAIVTTAPANALRIGQADSTTSIIVGRITSPVGPTRVPCGRLTLTTGTPVTTSDVTAATTLYYAPYGGCNQIDLYTGAYWAPYPFTQLSIAVPATTVTMYDVFVYDNSGTVTLELTAWTNDTTRATALTTQDGVYVKTGAVTRRWLGSFRTTGVSGQTEDSGFTCVTTVPKRYLYNYYHRLPRPICHVDTTANWAYSSATIRQARASALNQVEIVNGVAEDPIHLEVNVKIANNAVASFGIVSIGENSTTTTAAGFAGGNGQSNGTSLFANLLGTLHKIPPVGFSYYAWLEAAEAAGATNWYGASLVTGGGASGINGWVKQ